MSPGQERLAHTAADRLFAHMLHVEGCFTLPLRHHHPCVESTQNHHVAKTFEQFLVVQQAAPWTDCFTVSVEDPDDRIGQVADRLRIGVHLRPRHRSRFRNPDAREIGSATGPNRWLRHMEAQRGIVRHFLGVSHSRSVVAVHSACIGDRVADPTTTCDKAHARPPLRYGPDQRVLRCWLKTGTTGAYVTPPHRSKVW